MTNFWIKSLNYKQFSCMAALAFCLASCGEQSQALPVSTAPLPQMQAARYYLNAQPSTKEVIEQLDPTTMTRMEVLDGQKAADYTHDATIQKAILVQTK